MLEKTRESPLDCKDIESVNPEGNQSWIFIGRTDAEAPIVWPPDSKNWLIKKDPDAGKDWRQEEKGTTEDEMVGWHHQVDEDEFEQGPGVGAGQGSLVCCSLWGRNESDTTEWVNSNWFTGAPYIMNINLLSFFTCQSCQSFSFYVLSDFWFQMMSSTLIYTCSSIFCPDVFMDFCL